MKEKANEIHSSVVGEFFLRGIQVLLYNIVSLNNLIHELHVL